MTDLATSVQYAQVEYLRIAQAQVAAPAESVPAPKKIDVSRYLPPTAVRVTILVTVVPPTGSVLVYAPGYEESGVIFKGPISSADVRLNGPFLYVQLADGTTDFSIQYLSWREP